MIFYRTAMFAAAINFALVPTIASAGHYGYLLPKHHYVPPHHHHYPKPPTP